MNPQAQPATLCSLRAKGEAKHYKNFKWPRFRGTRNPNQATARSWIAKQRLHPFWESVHLLVAAIGLFLSLSIGARAVLIDAAEKPLRVEILNQEK